jgi:hypothetical protein
MVWTEQRAVSYRQETDAQFLRALESVCAWHTCPKARMITNGRARFVQEDPQGYLERVQRQEDKRKRKREGGNDVGEPDDDDADDDDDDDDDSGARTPRSSKVRLRLHPTPHPPTPFLCSYKGLILQRQRSAASAGGRAGRAAVAAPSLAQTCSSLLDAIESLRDARWAATLTPIGCCVARTLTRGAVRWAGAVGGCGATCSVSFRRASTTPTITP